MRNHQLRASAGSSGGSPIYYSNPKFTYNWNYQSTGYWRGGSWKVFTHSGTPVSGNGSSGWTSELTFGMGPIGHGSAWASNEHDLSSIVGKWAMFAFAWELPQYFRADILFQNFRYQDDGGILNIPYSTTTVSPLQNYWVGYLGGEVNNLVNNSVWPLASSSQSKRYELEEATRYGRYNIRKGNTPSTYTGTVNSGSYYFIYYESSLAGTSSSAGHYNSLRNDRRFLLSKHAYLIGDYSQTPILYTP